MAQVKRAKHQNDFDAAFYQADQDPENLILYEHMYHLGQSLNNQLQKQEEFL